MEDNSKQKIQPVRGSILEQIKTNTISDTPVSTKCPKCGSVVSKAEKVLGKYLFGYSYQALKNVRSNSDLYIKRSNWNIDLIFANLSFTWIR